MSHPFVASSLRRFVALLALLATGCTHQAATPGTPIFDGKTLDGWKSSGFVGQTDPRVKDGCIILPVAELLAGVTYTRPTPKMNYEISLEAKRINGSDFFCGLTFPVADSYASLILGGWGGSLVGISSIDGDDASSNSTETMVSFVNGRWYQIRMRITPNRLQTWIDEEQVIDVDTTDKRIDIRVDIQECKPFGIASYQTTAAIRNIRITTLGPND